MTWLKYCLFSAYWPKMIARINKLLLIVLFISLANFSVYSVQHEAIKKSVSFIRFNEQSGRPPIRRVYKDYKGIKHIATGFNLERSDSEQIIASIDKDIDFDAIIEGRALLTIDQAEKLESYAILEAMKLVVDKIGGEHFERLSINQQIALISLALHSPSLIGRNLVRHIKNNDFNMAEYEIRQRSNAKKHYGIQLRRHREADVFRDESALHIYDFRLSK